MSPTKAELPHSSTSPPSRVERRGWGAGVHHKKVPSARPQSRGTAGDDHKALRKIAAALLAKAAGGDVPAINSLADRTDGKVAQALIGDSEEDGVRLIHTITRKIVEPDAK